MPKTNDELKQDLTGKQELSEDELDNVTGGRINIPKTLIELILKKLGVNSMNKDDNTDKKVDGIFGDNNKNIM